MWWPILVCPAGPIQWTRALDLDATVGALFHFFGQRVDGLALVGVLAHGNAVAHGDLRGGCGHDTKGQAQAQHQFAQFHSIAPLGSVDDVKLRINLSYKFHYGVTFGHAA
jgi:hypothetical protein